MCLAFACRARENGQPESPARPHTNTERKRINKKQNKSLTSSTDKEIQREKEIRRMESVVDFFLLRPTLCNVKKSKTRRGRSLHKIKGFLLLCFHFENGHHLFEWNVR